MKHLILQTLLFAGILLVFAGCESGPSPAEEAEVDPQAPPVEDPFIKNYFALEKGLSEEVVRQRLGAPGKVETRVVEGVELEVWHYVHDLASQVRMTTKGMIEEPYWDIFENEMKTREVAVEGTERLEVHARIELLFFENQLVSWKDQIERKRVDY